MKFMTITNGMIDALHDFIMEQMTDDLDAYDVYSMLDAAFEQLDRIKGGVLPVGSIQRYAFTAVGGYSDDILPVEKENCGTIYKNMIHLGTVFTDKFEMDEPTEKKMICGYDVVYDLDSCEVKALYRIEFSDSDVTTVYRVETERFEDLFAAEFIISLSVQIAEKLRDGAEYLRKVCDRNCD